MDKLKLTFGNGNAKIDSKIITFSLPAAITCPFARDCKAKVVLINNKRKLIRDKNAKFQCFAATSELLFKNTFLARRYNLKLLRRAKTVDRMTDLIMRSLPNNFDKCRIHVSGDFYSKDYLQAWINVAKRLPQKTFYAYTKSVPFIVEKKKLIPSNLVITCSMGGLNDKLIEKNNLKRAKVYFHPDDAKKDGVKIDHDDSLAINPNIKRFGLLLHGVQKKNSDASKALSKMRKEHITFGYSK